MTEEALVEEVTGEEEALELPTPTISAGSEPAGSVETGFDAETFEQKLAQIEDQLSKLPDLIDARVKSTKDKRFSKLEKWEEMIVAAGGDPEKIRPTVERDELLNRIDSLEKRLSGDPGRSSATGTQVSEEEVKAATAKILSEAGIVPTEEVVAEIKALSAEPVFKVDDWYAKVAGYATKKIKQGGVTASAAVGKPGKPASPQSGDELLAEIEQLQKHPVKNRQLIAQKMKEARDQGLL